MIVNEEALDLAFKGFKTVYTDAYTAAEAQYDKIAMTISSSVRDETYGWLGQWPILREWLDGERVIKDLKAHGFTIVNRKFESTIGLKREDIADDRLGVFKPMVAEMGHRSKQHPDELIFGLLKAGFTELCYDGQYFFDAEHPAVGADGKSVDGGGNPILVSNMQDGTDPAWYLFDTSRAIKPIIWQMRENYDFVAVTRTDDQHVFMTDKYLYGVRARVNAGFGLWQMAFASRAPLTAENYAAARQAMMLLRGDQGRFLGIVPNTLVIPPQLETAARNLLGADTLDGGATNPWKGTASIVMTPHVA